MRKFKVLSALAIVAGLAASAATHAATISLNSISSWDTKVHVVITGGASTFDSDEVAAKFNWTYSSPTVSTTAFSTFCIEVPQFVGVPASYSYQDDHVYATPPGTAYDYYKSELKNAPTPTTPPVGGMGVTAATNLAHLFGSYFNTTTAGAVLAGGHVVTSSEAIANAGIFQSVVWKIVYGANITLSNAVGFSLTDVNTWYNAATSPTYAGPSADLFALSSQSYQDQVSGDVPNNPSSVIPLPTSALGGSVLLIGTLVGRKLKQKA